MRVLHLMAGKTHGGAELYSTDVMLSLHRAGIDQCVVMHPEAPRAGELGKAGLRMAPHVLRHRWRLWQKIQMRRLIEREKPDIIHCWMRRAASLTPATARRHADVVGWFGDYEEVRHFSQCSHFVGVTPDLVRHMREQGVETERSTYIPAFSSVDDGQALDRSALGTPVEAKVLLTLSRLHPVKGLDTALRALALLPECYLWIAGDGPLQDELKTLAQGLGVAERTRFLGWRTDRGALLRAADVCLLPSRYEPFGTVMLDAWSTQTPVVACDCDGPRAYVRHGENGMLAPCDDSAVLAGVVRAVLEDEPLRRRITAQGYAECLAGFTREAVTRRWISFYEALHTARRGDQAAGT